MTDAEFIALLEKHDWYFERSEDNREYSRGLASQKKLLYLCQQHPKLFRLYNHASNCVIRNAPFDFPSIIGTTQVKDETQHTQTAKPMKDLLWPIFEPLVNKLVEAIDRNTAAKLGTVAAPTSVGPTGEATAPAEKATKAAKAPKAAPAPAPEPEPAADLPAISEDRLKATVKTLPNEKKTVLKEYFKAKFGYNTMAEIAEENRADIHAKAVSFGAVDTDPADIGDM